MIRWARIPAMLTACAILSACATLHPEAKRKEEPPTLSVRLPIAEATTLDIESRPSIGKPELPLSVADEMRGRWLTLFEVNYSPSKPPLPLLPALEEPPVRRPADRGP